MDFLRCSGIYLERFVTEPISLNYMQAISVFTSGMIAPFFQQLPDTKYEECLNETYFRMIPIEHLDKIRALLRKYNYDVPIIDICSGILYKENKKYRKYAKKNTK